MRSIVVLVALVFGCAPCLADFDEDKQADVLMIALPATAYLLTVKKNDDDGTWQLARSLGLSAISTLALNAVIDKKSPNGKSNHAFPSGHATIAFSSAAFIQRRYGWKGGVPAYLVASYTGWLRLETDDHDVADVVGGAAIGMLSAYLLSDRFADSIRTSAWTNGRSGGLQVEVRW